MNTIFTIGYSTHSMQRFIELLNRHGIATVIDVRSAPYSRYNPRFNKDALMRELNSKCFGYVYLGRELGPRSSDPACFRDGKVQYDLLARTDLFKNGIERLKNQIRSERTALMCAEKDPITCHRMILICRQLRSESLEIFHILEDGSLESNPDAEHRLMQLVKVPQHTLFDTPEDLIQLAYDKQAQRIAFMRPASPG